LQAGGHRFDPGTLHLKTRWKRRFSAGVGRRGRSTRSWKGFGTTPRARAAPGLRSMSAWRPWRLGGLPPASRQARDESTLQIGQSAHSGLRLLVVPCFHHERIRLEPRHARLVQRGRTECLQFLRRARVCQSPASRRALLLGLRSRDDCRIAARRESRDPRLAGQSLQFKQGAAKLKCSDRRGVARQGHRMCQWSARRRHCGGATPRVRRRFRCTGYILASCPLISPLGFFAVWTLTYSLWCNSAFFTAREIVFLP
jgi:hypothetical protein